MEKKDNKEKVEIINTSTLGPKELAKIRAMAMTKANEIASESESKIDKPKLRGEKNKSSNINKISTNKSSDKLNNIPKSREARNKNIDKINSASKNKSDSIKTRTEKNKDIDNLNSDFVSKDSKIEKPISQSTTKKELSPITSKKEEKVQEKQIEKKDINKQNKDTTQKTVVKKKFKWNIVIAILLVISLITTTIFSISLIQLNILPIVYSIIIIVLLVGLFVLNCFLLQRKKGKVAKTIGTILLVITLLFAGIGSYYLIVTNSFFNKAFKEGKDKFVNTYQVLIKNTDNYTDIKELNNKKIGYYVTIPNAEDALKKLEESITYEKVSYENIMDNFTALDNNTIQGLLIEKSVYESILDSMDDIKNKEYKVLYSFDITFEMEVEKKEVKGNGINIYIGGPDFTGTNYDFNMIATLNNDTHKILLTSTVGKGMKDLLSYAGVWGINTSIATIEKLYSTDMNYFIKINTSSLVELVDVLGGVQFCSSKAFTTNHAMVIGTYDDTKGPKLSVAKGCKTYSGIEILTIARERKAYKDGDRQRQKNCQEIIISIFKKMASLNSLANYTKVLDSVSNFYTTNIPKDKITEFAQSMIAGNNWTFEQQSVTGSDSSGYVHLGTVKDYVMLPNKDSVNSAISNIKRVMNES